MENHNPYQHCKESDLHSIRFDILRRLSQKEVCEMDLQKLWECFCLTGEPLVYLLYQAARDQAAGGAEA